jgi:antirestriction protein ArdC
MKKQATKFDLYQTVTDRVIALMQEHGANWVNPFKKAGVAYQPTNPITGKAYRGINTFLLATTAYGAPYWAGYGQWAEKKCQVRRGERATMIVYWKMLEKTTVVDGEAKKTTRPMLRYLAVFNAAQVDGEYAAGLVAAPVPEKPCEAAMIATADAVFAATGARIVSDRSARAFYSPSEDFIHMPVRECFEATATSSATECYYGTLAHELTHWTGHASRLNRDLSNRFGTQAYAFEELVAELGSAMLCAELGISIEPRADHAQYLNNWLAVLKSDNAAIIKAASLAKHAAALITAAGEEALPIAA